MDDVRDIQIKHIIREAHVRQRMYSNHECTADEIVSRTHNEQIIILADRIEELEKSTDVIAMLNAANVMDSQSELITELQQQVERIRNIKQHYVHINGSTISVPIIFVTDLEKAQECE